MTTEKAKVWLANIEKRDEALPKNQRTNRLVKSGYVSLITKQHQKQEDAEATSLEWRKNILKLGYARISINTLLYGSTGPIDRERIIVLLQYTGVGKDRELDYLKARGLKDLIATYVTMTPLERTLSGHPFIYSVLFPAATLYIQYEYICHILYKYSRCIA